MERRRERGNREGGHQPTRRREVALHPSLATLARWRQGVYRLLAALLLYPEAPTLATAPQAARHLRQRGNLFAPLAFYPLLERLWALVEALTPDDTPRLQQEYAYLFTPASTSLGIPLRETAYLDPSLSTPGEVLASLERHYAKAGVRPLTQGGTGPDHIAVQLEFVSFLCGKEADAWEGRAPLRAREAQDRQVEFLEEHPCRWLPYLHRALKRSADGSLFTLTAESAWAMVRHDADLLRGLLEVPLPPEVAYG